MNGRDVAFLVGGAAVGVALAMLLKQNESTCCARVSAAAREQVGEIPLFGGILQGIGDSINAWPSVPPLLDLFGVDP